MSGDGAAHFRSNRCPLPRHEGGLAVTLSIGRTQLGICFRQADFALYGSARNSPSSPFRYRFLGDKNTLVPFWPPLRRRLTSLAKPLSLGIAFAVRHKWGGKYETLN